MLMLGSRRLLAILLAVLLLNSPMTVAGPAAATSQVPVGSITASGSVRVGEVAVPAEGTLFSGDRVQTQNGNAVIRYRDGARIMLASESVANFGSGRMQLEKGLMSFQTAAGNGMVFGVSTLRLEPTTAKAAANVTLKDTKASVAVTEGTLKVVDPSGVQLASLRAGDARLFEEAGAGVPSSPSASAPAAPPQGGGSSASSNGSRKWLIALGAAVVGTSIGVAGLVRANDANNATDAANASAASASASAAAASALATQLQAQNAALAAQVSALQAQASSLQSQLNGVFASSAQLASIQATVATQVAALSAAQAQLATVQQQTSTLLQTIAAQGGTATPAQLSQLQSLSTSLTGITTAIQTITTNINTAVLAAQQALAALCAVSPTTKGCPGH